MQVKFENLYNNQQQNELFRVNNKLDEALDISNDIILNQNYKQNSQVLAFKTQKNCTKIFVFLAAMQVFIILGLAFYQLSSLKAYLIRKQII